MVVKAVVKTNGHPCFIRWSVVNAGKEKKVGKMNTEKSKPKLKARGEIMENFEPKKKKKRHGEGKRKIVKNQ